MTGKWRYIVINKALRGPVPPPNVYRRIEDRSNLPGHRVETRRELGTIEGWMDRAIASTPQWIRGLAGNTLWGALHKRALKVAPGQRDDAWLAVFRQILPCGDCRKHWDSMLEATPPPAAPDLFAWTVARHNEVNRRLGKPEMGLEDALKRWSGTS